MERNIYTKGLHLISAYRDVVYCHPQSGFRIVVTVGEFDNSVEIFDEKIDPMFHFQNAYVDLSFSVQIRFDIQPLTCPETCPQHTPVPL